MARIGLIGDNSIEYVRCLTDIWKNRDCAVLIDWRIPVNQAVKMLEEAGVSKCYVDRNDFFINALLEDKGISFIPFEKKSMKGEIIPQCIYDGFSANYNREEALILYSSGTTGEAKGVILSYYAINKNADMILDYMKLKKNDCLYICKTLAHSSTIVGELLVALKSGTNAVISPTIVPPRVWFSNMDKFGTTVVCLNPTLLSMFVSEITRRRVVPISLNRVYVSGSVLRKKVWEKAVKAFGNIKLYNVYGLSEAGPRVSAQIDEASTSNSVGVPLKEVEIKIVENGCIIREERKIGRVYVNTPCYMEGYTNKEFPLKNEKWHDTGDIGYYENGELFIVGRSDDLLINNAHNVYPCTVEKIICEYDGIDDCIVFEEEEQGRDVLKCIYTGKNNMHAKDLYNFCSERLASYEIPIVYIRVPKLEKNRNGKIDRLGTIAGSRENGYHYKK